MKNLIATASFCLLCFAAASAQNQKFALHTDQPDAVEIVDLSSGAISAIKSYQKTGGGCLVECPNPKTTALQLKTGSSQKVKLLNLGDKSSSEWVELRAGERLSFTAIFEKKSDVSWWKYGSDLLGGILGFFNECRNGSASAGRDAAMKAGLPFFLHGSEVSLASPDRFYSAWSEGKNEKISLVRLDGKVIWQSDRKDVRSIEFRALPAEAQRQIRRGHTYFLNVERAGGQSYQQKIYVLSNKELKRLQNFLN